MRQRYRELLREELELMEFLSVKDGKATVAAGEAPSPNCTVSMAEGDFLDMVAGRLNGQMAFLTGKLKVAGDMGLALKLGSFIKA